LKTYVFLAVVWCLGIFAPAVARAEQTMACPQGTYDMLDWFTLDSDIRWGYHMGGNTNPMYTLVEPGKFFWTKTGAGFPWDIQLYDSSYIYLWITEYSWTDKYTFKKFSGSGVPLAPRCAYAGAPGSAIRVADTNYEIHTSCNSFSVHSLGKAVNEVWGPYYMSFGGSLPANMKTLVVSYRYNCDANYQNCGDKEAYYLAQRYGVVQWEHYRLISGKYALVQRSTFNNVVQGAVQPDFACN
jgi:hypothetical protein